MTDKSAIRVGRKRSFDLSALVAALIISFVSCGGTLFSETSRVASSTMLDSALMFLYLILNFTIIYLILHQLFHYFDDDNSSLTRVGDFTTIDARFFIRVSLFLVLVWLIWILSHWPGTMRDDSIPQMFQALGYCNFYTQHPIIDTLWFGLFWKLGLFFGDLKVGLFIYVLVQAVVTSLVFSLIVSYLHMAGVSKGLITCIVAFYAFSRAVYQPIDTMSKDAFNGYLFALVVLLQVDMVRSNGAWLYRLPCVTFYSVALFLCIASKRTMMYVLIPSSILIAFYLRFQPNLGKKVIVFSFLPALVFLFLWNPISIKLTNADSNTTYEMYSIPEQEVTACIAADPSVLNEKEYGELNQYMDYEQAIEVFNPSRSDEVSAVVRQNPNNMALIKTWFKVLIRNPKECLKSFLNMSGKWFSLTTTIDYGHNMEDELLNPTRMKAWSSFFGGDSEKTEMALQGLRSKSICNSGFTKIAESFDEIQKLITPLCSYGLFAFAIPISILVYGLSRRLRALVLLSAIPFLLLLSFIVGPIALYWYSIPSVYIAPLVMCLPLALRYTEAPNECSICS